MNGGAIMCDPAETKTKLSAVKEIAGLIQSLLTILAVIIGAGWALWEFGLKRVSTPKLVIEHRVTSLRVSDDYRLIHLSVRHENKGETLVHLDSADIRIQRVLPLPKRVRDSIASGQSPAADGGVVIAWPMLCRLNQSTSAELEPSESHELTYEFVIPAYVDVLKVYSYFRNSEKTRDDGEIGWAQTSIYSVPKEEERSDGVENIAPNKNVRAVCARDS